MIDEEDVVEAVKIEHGQTSLLGVTPGNSEYSIEARAAYHHRRLIDDGAVQNKKPPASASGFMLFAMETL